MRFRRKMELSIIGLAIVAFMGCEDPQSLNNISVVDNPFVQRTDTLSQVVSISAFQDSVNWSNVSRLVMGKLPGYNTGIHFKILLDSALVDSVTFDSVYVRFERDLLYRADPDDQTVPGPVDVNLYDASGMTPDAESGAWGSPIRTIQMSFGGNDTTLQIDLDRDSVLSTLQYDTLKTMEFAMNLPTVTDIIQRFYSAETAFPPKVYFKYPTLDTVISRNILYDASVVSWNPADPGLDTTQFEYVSVLGAQKLQVRLNSDSLTFPAGEQLQHVIRALATLTVDSTASKVYLQSKVDSIPAVALTLRQLDADTCNCNAVSFNFKSVDSGQTNYTVTSIMQEAVAEPDSTTSFFIRPLNAGLDPGLLAFPKNPAGQSVLNVVVTSARVGKP
ncbi:MAG: hypothetical protein K9N34_00340 [Candidatus Marinimicrobia bacterium]|nr:hypothetical protein [Candidatus Neomarinimicrobiota bacterium]MCF7839208.1 hypothetical protein [Candidatus Neomarinimicrobiota bacterium]MCF7903015.1 hypothetical protein [Candidatus Neomarinimicrobiota bacterium]